MTEYERGLRDAEALCVAKPTAFAFSAAADIRALMDRDGLGLLIARVQIELWAISDIADFLTRAIGEKVRTPLNPVLQELADAFYALSNDTDTVVVTVKEGTANVGRS